MATLRKRGKRYTATITKYLPTGKRIVVETFHLGRVSKDIATLMRNEINKAEHLIKSGVLSKENYKDYFSWMNDEGNSKLISDRNLADSIDEYLSYKKIHIRESSLTRIQISLDRFLEVYKPKTSIKKFKTKHIVEFEKYSLKSKKEGGFEH